MLVALGKPSSNVPFMMPKRVAETDPNDADHRLHRLGPVRVQARRVEARRQGRLRQVRQVQARAASRLRGSPAARWSRSTASNGGRSPTSRPRSTRCWPARSTTSSSPPHDLLPVAEEGRERQAGRLEPARQPVRVPLQLDRTSRSTTRRSARRCSTPSTRRTSCKAVIGDPAYYKVCKAMFVCGTPLESTKGMEGMLESNFAEGAPAAEGRRLRRHADRADALDRPAGADQPRAGRQEPDGARRLQGRHAVDGLADASSRAASKKDPPTQGGWHAFLTSWVSADILNPVMTAFLNSSCDKALFGWPCDDEIEKLRDQYARETDPAKQKAIAEQVQVRCGAEPGRTSTSASGTSRRRCARTSTASSTAPVAGVLERDEEGS